MNVLITGAQFSNKGAQSMLFTVVNEVRDRYPDTEFYYLPLDYYKKDCFQRLENYRFHFVIDEKAGQDFPAKLGALQIAFRAANAQKILHSARKYGEVLALGKLWKKLDVVIDVSGYSLTSKFGISSINRVLRMIQTAKDYGVKTILMPQSYGPFDFPEDICKRNGASLQNVDLLFAREEDGVEQLRNCCGVTDKAILSPDIVLQAKEINWENVFTKKPELNYPILKTTGNVGIVPNMETVRNGKHDVVLSVYRLILKELRAAGKEVFIFRHSNDLQLCGEIYELVKDDEHCHLIEDEIDSLSYGPFVRQFDFIIASRYHSIVHAYREHVPALVLGWANKYQALTALFGQEQYVFDITANQDSCTFEISRQIVKLMESYEQESNRIETELLNIQKQNCFDCCRTLMDQL